MRGIEIDDADVLFQELWPERSAAANFLAQAGDNHVDIAPAELTAERQQVTLGAAGGQRVDDVENFQSCVATSQPRRSERYRTSH